jgi:hypothetical protein
LLNRNAAKKISGEHHLTRICSQWKECLRGEGDATQKAGTAEVSPRAKKRSNEDDQGKNKLFLIWVLSGFGSLRATAMP